MDRRSEGVPCVGQLDLVRALQGAQTAARHDDDLLSTLPTRGVAQVPWQASALVLHRGPAASARRDGVISEPVTGSTAGGLALRPQLLQLRLEGVP